MRIAYEVGLPLVAEADVNAPWNAHDTRVLIVAVLGIGIIVALIVGFKVHAFLASRSGRCSSASRPGSVRARSPSRTRTASAASSGTSAY